MSIVTHVVHALDKRAALGTGAPQLSARAICWACPAAGL
jgi:hypothetical protein